MRKTKTTIFDKFVLLLAVFATIGLICGIMAGKKDPIDNVYLAFAGLAYPFLLFINVVFLLWWLLRRKWIFATITIAIIAFGWHTLIATIGFFGNSGKEEKGDDKQIRMMTFNVHNFKPYGDEITEEITQKMIAVVKGQHPDVICFQEFFTRFKGPYDTVDSLKKLLNAPYYYFMPSMESESEAIGLAIFSRYPIQNKGFIEFENTGNGSIYVDLKVNNQTLRVYNVHLQSISFDKEDYTYLDKVKEMDAEVSSTKRIIRMLRTAFRKRSGQVKMMKAHMRNCQIPYVITGDFNDTPASYAVRQMTDSLQNAFIKKGQGLGRTYNGKFPNFQIDYIATTKEFEIINYKIIEAKLSDHFPVRSDILLKSPSN
jgi:endonuclease/exonuclease/phosphatase family metal-dependent hydrolase